LDVRKWRVWILTILSVFLFLGATPSASKEAAIATARITPELGASLTRDYELEVVVRPHDGDAWTRLARRITGDANRWEELAAFNDTGDALRSNQAVRVPFSLLRPQLQRRIITTLFPLDRASADGWKHVVVGARGVEGESLWNIAEWFTGDGANFTAIRKANPNQGLSTRKGDVILIPNRLLAAGFSGGTEEENARKTAAEIRQPQNDPAQRPAADENVPEASAETSAEVVAEAVAPPSTAEPPSLTYDRKSAKPHAVYRLQKGEALYSSVAIRFTGRVYAKDVGDVLDRIVSFNGIEDVARIPVGYRVKIPMDLLLPEYLPQDDPTRVASERAKRESTILARRSRAHGLSGVHVIIDAGHGGDDPGTTHEDVWEASYVYDVACRLKRVLEKKNGAKVSMTTRSKSAGYSVADKDVLAAITDHYVQTSPRYQLEDAVVGVNLRWYLANSIFNRTINGGAPKEKVIFISIHADSLHPSLRGAMAYVPGERFVKGSFQKSDQVYLARAEVRERPVVKHSRDESLVAEGLSRELAESIVGSFRETGLKVHPFNPVRDNVVRGSRPWVPAIIRHNVIPTRLLLEVCNLGNQKDRELIKTRRYRQQLADAISGGIAEFFEERGDGRSVVAAAAAK
jgi:N-acetylmuramoyl-L-alanine amidase